MTASAFQNLKSVLHISITFLDTCIHKYRYSVYINPIHLYLILYLIAVYIQTLYDVHLGNKMATHLSLHIFVNRVFF